MLVVIVPATARPQSVGTQDELNRRYEKKVLTLRVPAIGNKLVYDDGQMRQGKPGVGGLDNEIIVDKMAIHPREFEISGHRAAVMVDPQTGDRRLGIASEVKLTDELPTATPDVNQVDAAMQHIFATGQELQSRACAVEEAARFKEFVQSPRSAKRQAAEMACLPDGGRGYLVGNDMQIPKAIFTPDPHFTDAMRRQKTMQAHVVFAVRIDEQGRITDVIPVLSPDMAVAFDAGGILRTWKFQPASLQGNAVPAIVKVEINMHRN